ncbi:MAG: hypothetical protein WB816_01900 [Methylocystis sp.]
MKPEETLQFWTSRASVVRVRNVLNSLLWVVALSTPAFLLAAYFFQIDPILKYVFSLFAILPVLATLVTHFYFMFKDADRLQSEEFVSGSKSYRSLAVLTMARPSRWTLLVFRR